MNHMPLDEVLRIIALGAYLVGALALIVYFFSREEWLAHLGNSARDCGLRRPIRTTDRALRDHRHLAALDLYGSLSLFAVMSVAIFIVFAFRYKLWFAGGFVLAIAAIFLAYGVTWNEGTMPAVPLGLNVSICVWRW